VGGLVACQPPVLDPALAEPPGRGQAADHIAALEREKATTPVQAAAGFKTVVPASLAVHLFGAELKRTAAIATGEYNALHLAKIADIKFRCGL
jgi:hypothetical protein